MGFMVLNTDKHKLGRYWHLEDLKKVLYKANINF